jgi:hypothetical protein
MEGIRANQTRLFLDMDGVFCDFERGVQDLQAKIGVEIKTTPHLDQEGTTWKLIFENDPDFFAHLEPMAGAMQLWVAVKHYLRRAEQKVPIFLTGCPKGKYRPLAEKGKRQWIADNLLQGENEGRVEKVHVISVAEDSKLPQKFAYLEILEHLLQHVNSGEAIVIFCRPDQKKFFSQPATILIDDRAHAGPEWESEKGIFIRHESEPALVRNEVGTEKKMNRHFLNKKMRNEISKGAVTLTKAALNTLHKGGRRRARTAKKNTRRNRSVDERRKRQTRK